MSNLNPEEFGEVWDQTRPKDEFESPIGDPTSEELQQIAEAPSAGPFQVSDPDFFAPQNDYERRLHAHYLKVAQESGDELAAQRMKRLGR